MRIANLRGRGALVYGERGQERTVRSPRRRVVGSAATSLSCIPTGTPCGNGPLL